MRNSDYCSCHLTTPCKHLQHIKAEANDNKKSKITFSKVVQSLVFVFLNSGGHEQVDARRKWDCKASNV